VGALFGAHSPGLAGDEWPCSPAAPAGHAGIWLLVVCALKRPLARLPMRRSGRPAWPGRAGRPLRLRPAGLDRAGAVRALAGQRGGARWWPRCWWRRWSGAPRPHARPAPPRGWPSCRRASGPHFLFNTLNSAIALVREEPAKAETLLEDLSELFRHALADAQEAVPLWQELALAEHYLAIEQVRFGDRLRVEWNVDERPPRPGCRR
jgi:two-component system, LytTR family, sensor histidine kinase AlgZ